MTTTLMGLRPPDSDQVPIHTDNLIDHIDHDLSHHADVFQINRIDIEPTTERFFDEGDFTVYVIKNVESETMNECLYCNDCGRQLDLPNEFEWAT